MSGFAGILHLDGSPVEPDLVRKLVEFQKFRGPDAQNTWISANVGLGHTLLKVTPESECERQPLSLDGHVWIVADCRVDARGPLIADLKTRGHTEIDRVPDVELILRAYLTWGQDCVCHLTGDFVFAIWDAAHRRLFCARDQMGVKPFYFAHVDSRLIFSNTLNCIRQHLAVSDNLNDLAIADFLLFDMIRDPGATSFRDIQRLPPAHTLTCTEAAVSVRRYWTLPVPEEIHHKNPRDCVDQFRELMDSAVAERLRTNSAGILMSGGLDSSTVAAFAKEILTRDDALPGLTAYTEVFDSLIPHEERYYANLVANALGIPIHFQSADDFGISQYLYHAAQSSPEPAHSPGSHDGNAQLRQIAQASRVALTGYGADPALCCLLTTHFGQLLKKKELGRFFLDAFSYLGAQGRFSRLYIHTRWTRWLGRDLGPCYPPWLNPELESRFALQDRWETLNRQPAPCAAPREVAYQSNTSPDWPFLFESYDAGTTGIPVEFLYPFFDLRLLNFLLALPALPWCSDKQLLREASRGALPDAVRLRRKSPLIADPLVALLQQSSSAWVDSFEPRPLLGHYVRRELVPKVFKEKDAWSAWIHLRPLTLNFWLRQQEASSISWKGAPIDSLEEAIPSA